MKKCDNCKNYIPEGMKLCPHCALLPPRLFPNFFLYLALSAVAVVCAVRFRPFAGAPSYPQVSMGMLWTAFLIFSVFALIFVFVCLTTFGAYKNRTYKGRLTKQEVAQFVRMKKHIEAGKHRYDNGKYCTVCGKKK